MSEEPKFILAFIICVSIGIFLFGKSCGRDSGIEDMQREAISKGHAIYNCSPTAGECKFEWK